MVENNKSKVGDAHFAKSSDRWRRLNSASSLRSPFFDDDIDLNRSVSQIDNYVKKKANVNLWMQFALDCDILSMISERERLTSTVIDGRICGLWDCVFHQFERMSQSDNTFQSGEHLRNDIFSQIKPNNNDKDTTGLQIFCIRFRCQLRIISLDQNLNDLIFGTNLLQSKEILHVGFEYFAPLTSDTGDKKYTLTSEDQELLSSFNKIEVKYKVNRQKVKTEREELEDMRRKLIGMETVDSFEILKRNTELLYDIYTPKQVDQMNDKIMCRLVLLNSHSGKAIPLERNKEMKFKEITLKNRRNCGYNAFQDDTVFVKVNDRVNQTGKVVGVNESHHKPVNSIYLCKVSQDQGTLMIPLNKFFPKIHVDNEPGRRYYEQNFKRNTFLRNAQKSSIDIEKESRKYADNIYYSIYSVEVDKNSKKVKFSLKNVKPFDPEICDKVFAVFYERWDPHYLYPCGKIVGVLSSFETLEDNFHLITSLSNVRSIEDTDQINKEVAEIERKSKCFVTDNYIPPGAIVFTIDNATTKDMDDALSFHREGQDIIIGVHISDVTKYISSTHQLYRQALKRFCTTYPPKFCHIPPIHLFGDKLSTDVLSLVPNEPRAVVSVFFKFTEKMQSKDFKLDEIINPKFSEGVIMSKHKLNYESVTCWLKQTEFPSDCPSEDLFIALKEIYEIARKLRRARLPESYFVRSTNEYLKDFDIKNQFEGEMLIEELMLLANEYVAKKIYEIYPDFTLLRMQNRVNDHEEWIEELFRLTNMNFAAQLKDFCKLLNEKISSDGRERGLVVSRRFFDKFSEFLSKEETVEKARNLLQYDDFYNDFYVHIIKWYEMSKPARYDCSIKDSVDNGHFSLAKPLYTHFTSPIRRFTDVIVHRLLKSVINGTEITDSSLDIHEVCDIANTRGRDNRTFEKLCAPYAIFNETDRKNCFILDCVCCEISNEEIKLVHPMLRKSSSERRIKFSDLSLDEVPLPFSRNDTNDKCSLKWRKIIFSCPPFDVGRRTFNNFQIDNHLFDCRLPSDCVKLFREIRRSYLSSKNLEAKLKELKNNFKYLEIDKIISSDSNSLVNPIINIGLEIFVKNTLRIQFSKYMKNGLQKICPELFIITPTFEICVIHKNDPVKFFISGGKLDLKHNDIIKRFQNVEEYKEYFRPLIHIESLTETLLDKSPFTLLSVPIIWIVGVSSKTRSIERYGVIKLAYKFCKSRNIIFNDENDDIIDRCEYIIHKGIHSVGGDLLCLRYFVENETKYWVGHGEIVRVGKFKSKSSDDFKVIVFRLTQCNFEFFPNPTEDIRYSADVYMKSIVSKRQEKAINSIDNIPLLKKIVLGSSELINKNIINAIHYNPRGKRNFKYNESQYKAIQKAMTFKLSLIWGPPGTGKTHVGCELSKAFCMKNGMRNLRGVVLYCGPSNDCVDLVSSDMKAKFIENCPRMLRIYGEQQELIDFPLPGIFTKKENKLIGEMEEISLHHLIRRTGSNLAKEIDMYDKIFSDILSSANQNENRKNIHQDIYNIILAYKNVVKKAKIEYIENNRIEMVLCTTTVAASAIMKQFSILQVIVDEAGMCKEPETLIPISRAESTVENVVLIGDHKQLRPIIHSKVANKRGLQISLFERYQELRPESVTMLNNQYRMHPSICEFPSKQFYDGFLKTQISHRWSGLGKEVMIEGCDYCNWNGINYSQCQPHYKALLTTNHYNAIPNSKWPGQRKTKYVCFDFPFEVYPERLVFINVVGDEIIQSVSTITGNENSRGNRQEVEAVGHVYRKLIESLKPPRQAQEYVTVLTQYKLQQHLLHNKCKEILKNKRNEMDPDVKTVIRSQGSENEYIIFSTVRSLRNREDINNNPTPGWEKEYLGFITDANQVNVALTRARKGLIIIGNKHLLRVNHIWKELISDLESRKCVLDNYLEFPY